ncbi:MAG: 50S ribosomal protein L25/general stress protein Ctc [Alphaproteobacteria bacterium]
MSETVTIEAEAKAAAGTSVAREARRGGRVPGIVYGGGGEPMMITVESRALVRLLNKGGFFSHLWDLRVGGKSIRVVAQDLQLHPVSDKPLHIDFKRVLAGEKITVSVPVHFLNEEKSPGLKRGGMLNIVRHEVELVCDPDNIPEGIDFDLDGLEIGDSIHISATSLPAGVVPAIADRDFTVASIAAPTVVSDEAEEEAGADDEDEDDKDEQA